MEKSKLNQAVQDALAERVRLLRDAADTTRKGATHAESKAENDKDTRSLEASYLARGQAMRVEETLEVQKKLRFFAFAPFDEESPIGLGALVRVEDDDGASRWYCLAPVGGGLKVSIGDTEISLVTPSAPFGRALLGRMVDDEVTVAVAGKKREYTIVSLL